jgi:hypothetical protein
MAMAMPATKSIGPTAAHHAHYALRPRRRAAIGWSIIALVCGACHAAIPPTPGHGGPRWLELTSEHFVVWTDATIAEGTAAIDTMEHVRQIMFGVSVFNPTTAAKTFVIAMRYQREVEPYLGRGFAAFAWPPSFPLYRPGLVVSIDGLDRDRRLVIHELAHAISYNAFSVQPHWFAEGLASYFETIQLDERDGAFELGKPLDAWLRVLREPQGLTRIADMFACKSQSCEDAQFYASAWAMYSYLANRRPADLLRYVGQLVARPADEQAAAWPAVFLDLTPAVLDGVLDSWIKVGDLTIHHYKVKLQPVAIARRVLDDSEVLTARALLLHRIGKRPDAELAAALAADPTNVVANMLDMDVHAMDLAVARSLTTAHPRDWRAWWLVVLASKDAAEIGAARTRVCALIATDPAVLPRGVCSGGAVGGAVD